MTVSACDFMDWIMGDLTQRGVIDESAIPDEEDSVSECGDLALAGIDKLAKRRDELAAAIRAVIAKFESNPDDLETMDAGIKLLKAALGEPETTARGNRIVIVLEGGLVQNVITETGHRIPTVGRWQSFGWKVLDPYEVEAHKVGKVLA